MSYTLTRIVEIYDDDPQNTKLVDEVCEQLKDAVPECSEKEAECAKCKAFSCSRHLHGRICGNCFDEARRRTLQRLFDIKAILM